MPSNCEGVREDDKVRPLEMCQSCQHWRSTTGPKVTPHIVIVYRDAMPVLVCERRQAVKAD